MTFARGIALLLVSCFGLLAPERALATPGEAESVEARGSAGERSEKARGSDSTRESAEEVLQLELGSPYSPLVRENFYHVLARSPTKAFLWELALPGAGHIYNGFPIQAGVAIGLTCVGAALWIAGAARELPALWWVGMGTFAAGRLYGWISAPVTAVLLNAAYRRQFGITGSF